MRKIIFSLLLFFSLFFISCLNNFNDHCIVILFEPNGGAELKDFKIDLKVGNFVIPHASKAGHVFEGWYQERSLETIATDDYIRSLERNTVITVYAKWSKITYTIAFNTNGGSRVDNLTLFYGDTFNLEKSFKPGFVFGGWYENEELFTQESMPDRNIVLEARWEETDFRVRFDTDGGEFIDDQYYRYAGQITLPIPRKEGYSFAGWYENETKFYSFSMPERNIVLKAKWIINSYTIKFNSNGGLSVKSLNLNYLGKINLPTPTRTGFTFTGWVKDDTLFQENRMPSYDIILNATWKINTHELVFDSDGGDFFPSRILEYNKFLILPIPTKSGYDFLGWQEDGREFVLTSMPNRKVTLKATWVEKNYNVFLDTRGGEGITSFKQAYNSLLNLPTPTRSGYNFLGWFDVNGLVVNKIMPGRDIYLYASWEKEKRTITFDFNNGNELIYHEFKIYETISFPKPTNTGHTFLGWYYNDILFTETRMPNESIKLTAKWAQN